MKDNFSVEDKEGGYYIENDSIREIYLELVEVQQFYKLTSSFFLPSDYYQGNIVIYKNPPGREGEIYGEEMYENSLKIKIPEDIKGKISSIDLITKREVQNIGGNEIRYNISEGVLEIYNTTKGQIFDIVFHLNNDEEDFVIFDYCPSFAGHRLNVDEIYDMDITFKLPQEISGEALLIHKAKAYPISIQCEDTIDVSVPKESRLDISKLFENKISDYTSELIILPDNYCPFSIQIENFEENEILVESLRDLSEIEIKSELPLLREIEFKRDEIGLESITESHLRNYEEFNKYNDIKEDKLIRCLPGQYQVNLSKDFCDFQEVQVGIGKNKTVEFGEESVGNVNKEFFIESDSDSVLMCMNEVSSSVPTNEKFRVKTHNLSSGKITFKDINERKTKEINLESLKRNYYINL